MKKRLVYILLFLVGEKTVCAQQSIIDSLRHQIETTQNDTFKISLLRTLSEAYREPRIDSSAFFANQMLMLARKLNFKLDQAYALAQLAYSYQNAGNYSLSLQTFLSAFTIGEDPESEQNVRPAIYIDQDQFLSHPVTAQMLRLGVLARAHLFTGILYSNTNNNEKAFDQYLKALQYAEQAGAIPETIGTNITLGRYYLSPNKPDSVIFFDQKAYELAEKSGFRKYIGSILLTLGKNQATIGNRNLAAAYYIRAIDSSKLQDYPRGAAAANLALSDLYTQSGKNDSSLYYANKALRIALELSAPNLILRVDTTLAGYYRSIHNKDSTLKYQEQIIKMNNSLFSSKNTKEFENIDFNEKQRHQQIEEAKSAYRVKIRMYALLAGLAIFLLLAAILWRNNLQRKKANTLLSRQKNELQRALSELKTTQAQLIQSEKMASLGELTAGIAHEIQNPLNFVNNFSELNLELMDDLKREIDRRNETAIETTSTNIRQNLEKINQHGKRADAIVKSMLQHSMTSTGQKELVNINSLAEEYLRLSFLGMKARDKNFHCEIKHDFDNSISQLKLIPQDMGRVFLNLFNNAFYSVNKKKKSLNGEFEPIVTVSTKRNGENVEIRIRDNGLGIPQKIEDKIFQPFFTTKPTGQGTGLGLSLTYDIITKEHGGKIRVDTKEGEYAEFIIELPAFAKPQYPVQ